MEIQMISDNISKKVEYFEFNKYIKISGFSLIITILFVYFSQFFSINKFLIFIDIAVAVFFVSSMILSLIKSLNLIKVFNFEDKYDYEHTKTKNLMGIFFLFVIFIIGVALIFMQNNYRVSANVLSIFFMSIPILSFYFKKIK